MVMYSASVTEKKKTLNVLVFLIYILLEVEKYFTKEK